VGANNIKLPGCGIVKEKGGKGKGGGKGGGGGGGTSKQPQGPSHHCLYHYHCWLAAKREKRKGGEEF